MKKIYNKAYHLFISTTIAGLKKYETNGISIFEFYEDDIENITFNKIIDNIPCIYILEKQHAIREFYIGETDKFSKRINDHIRNKKDFDKIYVINSEHFNKNICLQLESKTIEVLKNSHANYKITNINTNNNSYLSDFDKLKFLEFWEIFIQIYYLLNLKINSKNILENNDDGNNKEEDTLFYYKKQAMKIVDGGYLLLKNSQIFNGEWKADANWISEKTKKLRSSLNKENRMDENNKLNENLLHPFPSPLATLISGGSENGYVSWKTAEGKTLNEYLKRKLNKNEVKAWTQIWKQTYKNNTSGLDPWGRIIKYYDYGEQTENGWEIDHINPVSNKGSNDISNLQPLHWESNKEKADVIGCIRNQKCIKL